MAMPSTPSYMNSNNSVPPASVTITPLFQPQISSTVKSPLFATTATAGPGPGGLKFEDIKLNTFRQIHQQQPIKSENTEVENASSIAGDAAASIKCEFCEYRCSKKDRLTRHVRNVHYKEKPHGCELCDACFGRKDKLKRHMSTVHSQDRPFKCDFCAHSSGRKDKIREHIQSVHLKNRPVRPKRSHKKKVLPTTAVQSSTSVPVTIPNIVLPQHPVPPQEIPNHLHFHKFAADHANNLVTLTPLPTFVPTNISYHGGHTHQAFPHPHHLISN